MIKLTEDGSTTIYNESFNQYYHSIFGAKTESECVFINLGLKYAFKNFRNIEILEMGFGTGLNALLTLEYCNIAQKSVNYETIEAYPLKAESMVDLSFDSSLFHNCEWESWHEISPFMNFKKHHASLEAFDSMDKFNLVYYDAFAPSSQPELWEQPIFEKVASIMNPGGILVTYCSKSYVQRNLRAAGYSVEKHPGPPRKREVLRAILK